MIVFIIFPFVRSIELSILDFRLDYSFLGQKWFGLNFINNLINDNYWNCVIIRIEITFYVLLGIHNGVSNDNAREYALQESRGIFNYA